MVAFAFTDEELDYVEQLIAQIKSAQDNMDTDDIEDMKSELKTLFLLLGMACYVGSLEAEPEGEGNAVSIYKAVC